MDHSREDWRHSAECRPGNGYDAELWFPVGSTGGANLLQIAEARSVCNNLCPAWVRAECLAESMDRGLDHGIFGGLTEEERRALKRRNARARARSKA